MHAHYLVWMDHREAKIFAIGLDGTDEHKVTDNGPSHHVRRKADHLERAKSGAEHEFLSEIAASLEPARGIMIAGPGDARTELGAFLAAHYPQIAERVWVNEAMDHPTDPQLVATARTYFKAGSAMHG